MNDKLLIVGAGIYGLVASEIASEMGVFTTIDFADDNQKVSVAGKPVAGTTHQLDELLVQYQNVVVAIGNPKVRMALLEKIEAMKKCRIVTLISPKAYISPTAKIEAGCIIEPMAVVHSKSVLKKGCIVSAGAVINHNVVCNEGVHVDCNATVEGSSVVPGNTKISSGDVYNVTI